MLTPDKIQASLDEADELHAAYLDELAAADRGEQLPPLDPATLSCPNLRPDAGPRRPA